jgi:uncharacterized membrane protein YdjX (TVP38/TMEM64 family)
MRARPPVVSAVLLLAAIGGALWLALEGGFTAGTLAALAERHVHGAAAPFLVALAFVVLGFLFVPVMLLIAVCGLAFGPFAGALYALLGALASGTAGWLAGRQWREAVLARCSGLAEKLRARVADRGLVAVILIRLVPSGPFTLTNLIAGAIGIRFRDMVIGTTLGLVPGILVTVGLVRLFSGPA